MFTPISSLLKTLPRRSKISQAMMAIYVRKAFEQALPEVCADLSDSILIQVKAQSFKSGVLSVKAPSLLSTELQMRSGGLLRAINESLGRKLVNRLRFKAG